MITIPLHARLLLYLGAGLAELHRILRPKLLFADKPQVVQR